MGLEEKVHICVLDTFNLRRFVWYQLIALENKVWADISDCSCVGAVANITVSSAYANEVGNLSKRSFTAMLNRTGPRIDPCGTPDTIELVDDNCIRDFHNLLPISQIRL